MTRTLRVLLAVLLVTALLPLPAQPLVPLPPTVPPGVSPEWTPVPGTPGVEYAPNLKVDLFRHGGLYYYWVAEPMAHRGYPHRALEADVRGAPGDAPA